jgi:zinc transporter ZupT
VAVLFELLGFIFGYYFLKGTSLELLGASLALAAGFMTYISVEELIPAAQIKQNLKEGITGLILGLVCVLVIGFLG